MKKEKKRLVIQSHGSVDVQQTYSLFTKHKAKVFFLSNMDIPLKEIRKVQKVTENFRIVRCVCSNWVLDFVYIKDKIAYHQNN